MLLINHIKECAVSNAFKVCFLICFFTTILADGAAVPHVFSEHVAIKTHLKREVNCDMTGDPDLYGLGIRLGVYFQWVTAFIANCWVPEEIESQLDANTIFMFAIYVAMQRVTLLRTLRSVDAIILLQISFGYFFSVLSLFGYRTRLYGKIYISTVGTWARLFLTGAISGYSVWYWFDGVVAMQQGPCPPVMFMFAKVRVLGWARYVWKTAALLCAGYFGLLVLVGVVSALIWAGVLCHVSFFGPQHGGWQHFWELVTQSLPEEKDMKVDVQQAKKSYHLLRLFNLVFIPYSIIAIEFTINWNHLQSVTGLHGIYPTGQLIPALIGAAGLGRLLWVLLLQSTETPEKPRSNVVDDDLKVVTVKSYQSRFSPLDGFKYHSKFLYWILSFSFIQRRERPRPIPEETVESTAAEHVTEIDAITTLSAETKQQGGNVKEIKI